MRVLKKLWVIIPGLMLQSCPWYGYNYNTGTFPTTPVNFSEMNTEYDDYNASAPTLGEMVPLCFSTNRSSKGENFNLIYKPFSIVFSKTTGKLSIGAEYEVYGEWMLENSMLENGMRKVNSTNDELGPFLVHHDYVITEDNVRYNSYFLLYSNNEYGDLDIRYTHNTNTKNWEEPVPVSFLNSEADDAYPSFNSDRSGIWFCSNRDQTFDIYKAHTDPEMEVIDILESGATVTIEKDTILSSLWDDKCPYIVYNSRMEFAEKVSNNLLIFASNREGGLGGFDLYYSELENGEWSKPQNFGAEINTEYDEYRPIVRPQYDFTNDFLLFSSNRPGGHGGFDLYYVGIQDIKIEK